MAYLPEKKRMTLQGLFDAICETFSEEEAHAVARTLGIGTAHLRPEAGVGFEYLENR